MSARIVKAFGFVASQKFVEDCDYDVNHFQFGNKNQFFVGIELERKNPEQLVSIGNEINYQEKYNEFVESTIATVMKAKWADVAYRDKWIENFKKSIPSLNVFLT